MNPKSNDKSRSKCCLAPMRVSSGSEGTSCYVCTKCGRPTDAYWLPDQPTAPTVRPDDNWTPPNHPMEVGSPAQPIPSWAVEAARAWYAHTYNDTASNLALGGITNLARIIARHAPTPSAPDALTAFEFLRLRDWFAAPKRKPANLAFTAGAARDAATAFEMAQSTPSAESDTAMLRTIQKRLCTSHEAAEAFWKYWNDNGVPHKHGFFESTWGGFRSALLAAMKGEQGEWK